MKVTAVNRKKRSADGLNQTMKDLNDSRCIFFCNFYVDDELFLRKLTDEHFTFFPGKKISAGF